MSPYTLQLEHEFAASPDRIWRAWTTEDGLAAWWWPTWSPTISIDLRVGGGYRIEAADPKIIVEGRYVIIEPVSHLRMTWIWTDPDGAGPEEEVDVTFAPEGVGTLIRLQHTGPWTSAEPADNYRQGWTSVLDNLLRVVSL
ncbi:SRPBCC domain-containing protein [Microlunatus elymi]|uniref:SRPBCC domain-containing protein n=1 Tax=Microlunatus elymi TaxID=2596828 RepID=A0A516PYY7_9ACTN|nr:SRPBCC domain-containing protein [Microlunatus elymi]QDP96380.1 SRPBCC domain-containing protein [Microlunatus elymi]